MKIKVDNLGEYCREILWPQFYPEIVQERFDTLAHNNPNFPYSFKEFRKKFFIYKYSQIIIILLNIISFITFGMLLEISSWYYILLFVIYIIGFYFINKSVLLRGNDSYTDGAMFMLCAVYDIVPMIFMLINIVPGIFALGELALYIFIFPPVLSYIFIKFGTFLFWRIMEKK